MNNELNNTGDPDETIMPMLNTDRKPGGLYRNVKMSVNSANKLVFICILVFIGCMVFAIINNGFTVSFDTNGGSYVESVRVMHSDKLNVLQEPVKEGWVFTGWYADRDCTQKWNGSTDVITESMTLYS